MGLPAAVVPRPRDERDAQTLRVHAPLPASPVGKSPQHRVGRIAISGIPPSSGDAADGKRARE
jgi:hypothetical protein